MKPGPRRDLRNAARQIRGARTSLSNLRIGLKGKADERALWAMATLYGVLVALDAVGRMEARK